jgi:glycosyltransferase involved in cell wall biosynthesis
MPHVLIIASLTESLVRFRREMIKAFLAAGCRVTAFAPNVHEPSIQELKAMGVDFQTYPLHRASLNPVQDVKTVITLRRMIKAVKPDLVLTYTIKPVIYGSLAAWLAGVPKRYAMISGLGYAFGTETTKQRIVGQVVTQLYRQSLRVNNAVFFQNPDDLNEFVARGILPREKTVLINGSGVELERFTPAPLSTDPISFLLIARLIAEKGVRDYAAAAVQLRTKYPNAQFHLVGPLDPSPLAIQASEVDEWVKEGALQYHGETNDVRPFIAQASVYVLPSYYREGTPRSVLEAMAMGRPIITTDMPGCRETVFNGENGFLIPPRDPVALAAAMEQFLQNPSLIAPMGQRSRELATTKYDVHQVNGVIVRTMDL